MNTIGTVKLPSGIVATLTPDGWQCEDARTAELFNKLFPMELEDDELSNGLPVGRRTVAMAAKAMNGTAEFPKMEPLPPGAVG